MKILLCLLSDQHVPNLLSVHHFQPDRLVLVESASMKSKNAAKNLLRALEAGHLDYRGRYHVEPLPDENNMETIRTSIQRAYDGSPDDQWIANITGGTKPMSIAAYEFFKEKSARVIYTPINCPSELLAVANGENETCRHRPKIREFVAGYGFECQQPPHALRTKEAYARKHWEAARTIAQYATGQSLVKEACSKRLKESPGQRIDLKRGEVQSSSPEVRDALCTTFGLEGTGSSLLGQIDRHIGHFIAGGWLEVFLWGLLDEHQNALRLWNVHLGLVIRPVNVRDGNEYDVGFMRDHALCTVECKSGGQWHDPKFDILYKVEATIRQFRALRVRSFIATTSELIYEKSRLKGRIIKPQIVSRAEAYNCQILGIDEIAGLAQKHVSADDVRKVFFA